MATDMREAILEAGRRAVQAHGYSGLNFRELASEVGIKGASIHYHFRTKADLGAAVARRYWESSDATLGALWDRYADPKEWLLHYPETFRQSLENDNRMCLASFMSAEHDDLPESVRIEVQAFAEINVKWLTRAVSAATGATPEESERRARSIFAAVSGAQLMARSRADIGVFDALMDGYRHFGLIPT
ncbi:TetR/AcrR family transcriptional regulator [Flavisphingomonas formosensis]|uniref:TetR/AcrR family transcriptional regulator n=1 Tax=Flavisphingomonas formosensis TaxID=861534 RepID=UPI0012FAAAE5|nr:TetR/AcrR family transcriptional regulator [Sphingomonas formosensis]